MPNIWVLCDTFQGSAKTRNMVLRNIMGVPPHLVNLQLQEVFFIEIIQHIGRIHDQINSEVLLKRKPSALVLITLL